MRCGFVTKFWCQPLPLCQFSCVWPCQGSCCNSRIEAHKQREREKDFTGMFGPVWVCHPSIWFQPLPLCQISCVYAFPDLCFRRIESHKQGEKLKDFNWIFDSLWVCDPHLQSSCVHWMEQRNLSIFSPSSWILGYVGVRMSRLCAWIRSFLHSAGFFHTMQMPMCAIRAPKHCILSSLSPLQGTRLEIAINVQINNHGGFGCASRRSSPGVAFAAAGNKQKKKGKEKRKSPGGTLSRGWSFDQLMLVWDEVFDKVCEDTELVAKMRTLGQNGLERYVCCWRRLTLCCAIETSGICWFPNMTNIALKIS